MQVASSREDSWEEDDADRAEVCVYTDGSGLDGRAGAAAVLFRDGHEMKALQYLLGPLTQHTTYEAEIIRVILAIQLIHKEGEANTASIKLDNQAVVQALTC